MIPDTGLSLFDQTINKEERRRKKNGWKTIVHSILYTYVYLYLPVQLV